ncbi:homeobox-leucine zipper protein HDG11-like [Cicer arietinum]|uniref:homeobox-leucine zipper protein HDG11-like n=1 Tax=Cicer arietinum TaxID=3827 RepID=UPI003CC5651D
MSNQMKFTQKTLNVIGGIRLSIRETGIGEPNGMVIVAASTIWLPQPSDKVIEFLTDPIKRPQWDVLSDGDPVNEIVHISNGLYPENFTSIIRPFDSNETGMVILHESFTSPFGSYLVYAPMDTALMNVAISGEEDLTLLEILPCGFVVSPICPSNEGNNNNNNTSGAGSLLTLAYQIFVADHYEENVNNLLNAQNVDTIVSLLTTTLKSVKDGLDQEKGFVALEKYYVKDAYQGLMQKSSVNRSSFGDDAWYKTILLKMSLLAWRLLHN